MNRFRSIDAFTPWPTWIRFHRVERDWQIANQLSDVTLANGNTLNPALLTD